MAEDSRLSTKRHRYEDGYWKPDVPENKRHYDKDLHPSVEHDRASTYFLVTPELAAQTEIQLTFDEIFDYYQTAVTSNSTFPDPDSLRLVAARLYSVAKKLENKGETDDHDIGKDCEKYCQTYESVAKSNPLSPSNIIELQREIEFIIHGCHTSTFPGDIFINGDRNEIINVLEAVAHWRGIKSGSLSQYYERNWIGKNREDRVRFDADYYK